MATMYEMIMDLPLFKGVGKDHVSLFLEKTNIGFSNYSDGETVIGSGEEARMVKFVISGAVRVIHSLDSVPVIVEETAGIGRVLGADRLFGMTTGYPFEVRALGRASIMEFSKEQYVNLLHSDRIYMLNFFNYLSLRAQRPVDAMNDYGGGDIRSRLSLLIGIMTSPDSTKIVVEAEEEALAAYCSTDVGSLRRWLRDASSAGLIRCDSRCRISILSRSAFL